MQIGNYININQAADQFLNQRSSDTVGSTSMTSFQDILSRKTSDSGQNDMTLRFSKHAASRLEDRNITMTEDQLSRLNEGTAKAEEKGIHDSLVMIDSLAFIVNVPNKTVVTAMDQSDANDNIFTNIDGAVIA